MEGSTPPTPEWPGPASVLSSASAAYPNRGGSRSQFQGTGPAHRARPSVNQIERVFPSIPRLRPLQARFEQPNVPPARLWARPDSTGKVSRTGRRQEVGNSARAHAQAEGKRPGSDDVGGSRRELHTAGGSPHNRGVGRSEANRCEPTAWQNKDPTSTCNRPAPGCVRTVVDSLGTCSATSVRDGTKGERRRDGKQPLARPSGWTPLRSEQE
eukprot:scaffold938_cov334-Pavlova_lutheri.AAC.19